MPAPHDDDPFPRLAQTLLSVAAKLLRSTGDIRQIDDEWLRIHVVARARRDNSQNLPQPQTPSSNVQPGKNA